VHHVGILYDQIMMHGQRNIKLCNRVVSLTYILGNIFLILQNRAEEG